MNHDLIRIVENLYFCVHRQIRYAERIVEAQDRVTSTSMRSGMSPGKHSTSISRMIDSRIPASTFTPRASPLTAIGTVTRIATSIAMR